MMPLLSGSGRSGKAWEGSACGEVTVETMGERRRLAVCDGARVSHVTGQAAGC